MTRTSSSRPCGTGALIDAARRRSHELREQAIAEFWDDLGGRTQRAARSLGRLARSLARHARLRGA